MAKKAIIKQVSVGRFMPGYNSNVTDNTGLPYEQ